MPKMEELLNEMLVENARAWTVHLFIQNIDLDYAYGQLKLSKQSSQQCVFTLTGEISTASKNRFPDLAIYPLVSEKNDWTLGYRSLAWLDDIIVVTRGNAPDQEKNIFDVPSKLEKVV